MVITVTVGIPTYNEETCIARAIQSIQNQDYPIEEILIVASGCEDCTVKIVKECARTDSRIRLIIEAERNGKASAINLINKYAKGDVIVQCDGDCFVTPDAVTNMVHYFKNHKVGAVSGRPVPVIPDGNLFSDWTHMSYNKMHDIRKKQDAAWEFWHLSGYLLAWRRFAFDEIPFVKGAVDAWMGKIIRENNYLIRYAEYALVVVKAPTNIKDFVAQKARVRAGYYFLPKNDMPRTIKKELFWLPKEFFKVPFWRWHKFIMSGLVYTYSWMKGKSMAKKNKSLEEIWKVPTSTK